MSKIKNTFLISSAIVFFLTLLYGFMPSNIFPTAFVKSTPLTQTSVTIRKSSSIDIFGEVHQPGTYTVQSERISLMELVKQAGDFTKIADKSSIVILRGNNGNRMITYANTKAQEVSLSNDILLQNNDVVYIESVDLNNTSAYNYKKILPFASAFFCVALFLFSAFKG